MGVCLNDTGSLATFGYPTSGGLNSYSLSYHRRRLHNHTYSVKVPRDSVSRYTWRCRSESTSADVIREKSSKKFVLPDGMALELIECKSEDTENDEKPILLFVHGSYHGAWCWRENFMPFFAQHGYDSVAISLRGQGESDRGDLKVSGTLGTHVEDLENVIKSLPRNVILIGHSFGGLMVEAYCSLPQTASGRAKISGVALLASTPPSGNKEIVARIMRDSLWKSFKITWGFVTRSFARDIQSCKYLFFSEDIPNTKVKAYYEKLAACSPLGIVDLGQLNNELPLPEVQKDIFITGNVHAFVAGGENDMVVDIPAIHETARYFGTQPVTWSNMAHDIMLDTRWEQAAESLRRWLDDVYN